MCSLVGRLNQTTQFKTIFTRHQNIRNNQIGEFPENLTPTLIPIIRHIHLKAVLQSNLNKLLKFPIVFNHHYREGTLDALALWQGLEGRKLLRRKLRLAFLSLAHCCLWQANGKQGSLVYFTFPIDASPMQL